jgi:dihydrofolate reductase
VKPPELYIKAYAIISSDGMIADENCLMPNSLKFDADQRFFETELERVDVVAHGRKSHEGMETSASRRRLLMTRSVDSLEPEPSASNILFWNPAGASLESACKAFGLPSAVVAITGGTAAYDLFLDRYDEVHLCRAGQVQLPGGTPVFSKVAHGRSPEDILRSHGLEPHAVRMLDLEHDLTHVCWRRKRKTAPRGA